MRSKIAVLLFLIATAGAAFDTEAQTADSEIKTAVLESRVKNDDTGTDNYERASFSFEKGSNGTVARTLTRNDWDVLFRASRTLDGTVLKDYFDVSMVVDDRSRILDLGPVEWSEVAKLPDLPAYETPTREKPVEAKLGNMYFVHTADGDSDLYALFRVEEMKSGESVVIRWKLVSAPAEVSK